MKNNLKKQSTSKCKIIAKTDRIILSKNYVRTYKHKILLK
jgi:hypothetical protein